MPPRGNFRISPSVRQPSCIKVVRCGAVALNTCIDNASRMSGSGCLKPLSTPARASISAARLFGAQARLLQPSSAAS